MNGKNSRGKKQKANVSIKEKQKKHQPKVKKTKKVGFIERLATPKPSRPRFLLRWLPTSRLFDQKGKIVDSDESKSQSDCSNGDNACTSNTLEPKIKRNLKLLINFIWKFIGTVRYGNDHVAAILGFGDLQWGIILITRVYFVEGLGHNWFSIGQFCDSDLEARRVDGRINCRLTGHVIGTPMATKPKLDADLSGNPVDQTDYHSKIRSLVYLTSSRPDIVQAGSSFELTAFLDADHARCIDTCKITSGGIQFLGDKLVSWISKKQNCTAMSSAEAEYVALSTSCAQVMWMRTQLQDYGFNYNKITLYCDSQSATAISCNPVQHFRAKHIHTRYHFIKEQVENGIIEIYFVRTECQLADMFTKALPEDRFKYLVRRIEHLSDTSVFTMKMEILLEPTANKLLVGLDDGVAASF
nr:hypothetical protein [Tanacetum cinerariifolium]